MGRGLAMLVAVMTIACTSGWKSQVTLVRPAGCESQLGASCVYTYESVTTERDGRCTAQQVAPGERLVSCRDYAERSSIEIAAIVAIVALPVATAAVLGFFALAAPAG